jgi:uncharacterized protein (DUF1778 family)
MTIEKLPDRRRRKRVIVRVEPELDEALKRAAEKDGRTVSGFLRSLAVERLEQQAVEAA